MGLRGFEALTEIAANPTGLDHEPPTPFPSCRGARRSLYRSPDRQEGAASVGTDDAYRVEYHHFRHVRVVPDGS